MTTKSVVLEYLKDYLADGYEWVWGGKIEDHVRQRTGTKASVVSVCLRIMQREGYIEKRKQQINGQGPSFVQYRYLTDTPAKKEKEPQANPLPGGNNFDVVERINATPARVPQPAQKEQRLI